MPLNFKHINGNEQIFDLSIGTSLIADGAITAAKLAAGSIPSHALIVDSNIDFNNFQALQFRVENINFFPIPGNPGRIIWRTDLEDLFVDSDVSLTISAARFIPLEVRNILSGTQMSVTSTVGMIAGDSLLQDGAPFTEIDITAIVDGTHMVVDSTVGIGVGFLITQDSASTTVTAVTDATHLIVTSTVGFTVDVALVSKPFALTTITTVLDATNLIVASTVGFVGQAITSVDFGIVSVTDGTHLVIDNSIAIVAGYTITQGLASTTVTSVTDLTHIIVASTTGFAPGITIVRVPIDILAIPSSNILNVSTTTGFGPGDAVTQGIAATTVTSVTDATHIVVVSTSGFALNAAADSTVIVNDTTNLHIGQYLRQGVFSSLILDVVNATHLAVADASVFTAGTGTVGNWVSINEGASVTSIHSDNNPLLHGSIQFLSGTNVHLPQVNQTITVNVPAAGTTGQIQFNNDVLNDFGADANLFWDNINKRLGLGNSAPTTTLDVTGNGHFSSDVTVDTAIHTPLVTGTSPLTLRPGTDSLNGISIQNASGSIPIMAFDTINNVTRFYSTGTDAQVLFYASDLATPLGQLDMTESGSLFRIANQVGDISLYSNTGNILLQTSNGGNNWTFDPSGVLTTAGDVIVPSANIIIKSAPSLANGLHFWGEVNEDENGQIDFYTHDGSQFLGEVAGWLRANSVFNGNPLTVIELNTFDSFTGATNSIQSRLTFVTRNAAGNPFTWGINEVGTFSNLPDFIATSLSAVMQLDSTTQGFLPPRMTTAQRDAIASPAIGLLIYNTDTSLYNFWTGIAWLPVGSPVGNIGDVQFNAGGGLFGANPNFYWDIANARLGIGNAAPAFTLDISGPMAIRNVSNTPGHGDLTFYNDSPSETTIESRSSDGSTVFGNLLLAAGGFELQSALGTGSISVNTFGSIETWNFNLDGSFNSPVSASVGYGNGVHAPTATLDVSGTATFNSGSVTIGMALTHEGGTGIHIDANPTGANSATIEMLGSSTNNNFSAIGFVTGDNATQVGLIYAENAGGTERIHIQAAGESQPGEVQIANGNGGIWTFDTTGALTVAGFIHNVTNPTAPQDAATKAYVDGPSHTVAGANTQVQFNNAGNFGADPNFTWVIGQGIHLLNSDAIYLESGATVGEIASISGFSIFNGTDALRLVSNSNSTPRTWTFETDGKLNLPGGDAFRNIDSSPTAIGNLDITTAGALNLRTTNGTGLWVTDNSTITQVGINNNTPANALDVHGETLLTAGTSNFQLRITDTLTGTRAGLRLASTSSTYGVIELEGAENNANLQIRASADATDIAVASIGDLRLQAASSNVYLRQGGELQLVNTPVVGIALLNDNEFYIAYNDSTNTITYANLVGGTDYTWKVTGQHDVFKIDLLNQSAVVATADDMTMDSSAVFNLNSTTKGLLPPRMTTVQRNAIATPATGLIIYNTDTNLLQIWNGTSWAPIGQAIFQQDIFDIVGPGNVFTLSFTPIASSQVVYYNGLALAPGVSEDYTISGNVVTLNGSIVLINGDKILVVYSHY